MKKNCLLCFGILLLISGSVSAQSFFQSVIQAGISLPVKSNGTNETHAGTGIHFGNHLNYVFGRKNFKAGLGIYVGYINSVNTNDKYKQIGQALAQKYGFPVSGLTFNESLFKSTHFLAGPVASYQKNNFSINLWAKGGYAFNDPSQYSVIYKENGIVNNIYVNQAGDNKNGIAYNIGAGLNFSISSMVALQLSANYFGANTSQVNYNYDREKGIIPLYFTAKNNFVQASIGLQLNIENRNRPGGNKTTLIDESNEENYARHKTKSNIKNDRIANPNTNIDEPSYERVKTKSNIKNDRLANANTNIDEPSYERVKTKSNIKNDRLANANTNIDEPSYERVKTKSNIKNDRLANANTNIETDTLVFDPEKIEIISAARQTPKRDFGEKMSQLLSTVDNYLTAFAYQTRDGAAINQCGASAMESDPIPGADVKLRCEGCNSPWLGKTNADGSFSIINIPPGNYQAIINKDTIDVAIKGNTTDENNGFRILDIPVNECTNANNVIYANDKMFVEVIAAREASSGMATGKKHIANVKYQDFKVAEPKDAATGLSTGKRMHKPLTVTNTDFDVNYSTIYTLDNKLYAEVTTAREASSGMATGRSIILTGDVDGDGYADNSIVAPRDAATGQASGKRMHKPFVVTINYDDANDVVAPRDAATGQASGKRMHKPFVVTINADDEDANDVVAPRDAATGQASGKRMHKPFVVTINYDDEDANDVVAPRDAATGQASGKRMHKPFVVTINYDDEDANDVVAPRDAATGQASGKRMHKPFVVTINYDDEDANDVVAPRDAATGQASGRRQYEPIIFSHEGITYKIIHRDIAARNLLANDGVSENFVNNPLYQDNGSSGTNPLSQKKIAIKEQGLPKKKSLENDSYNPWEDESSEALVNNPLYQSSDNSGSNPLFKSKGGFRITGSNGKDHTIFYPGTLMLKIANHPNLAQLTGFAGIEVMPIKWMAPESLNSSRKGWDGTVKGSGKNGIAPSTEKATINTTRSNIKHVSRISCSDGSCSIDAIVEIDGQLYNAIITGKFHDKSMASIRNLK